MLLKYGMNSSMWVDIKKSNDPNVLGPSSKIDKFLKRKSSTFKLSNK